MRVVYISECLALATLEYFVNLDTDLVSDGLVSLPVEIPSGLRVEVVPIDELPADWRTPRHEDFAAVSPGEPRPYSFDPRMWK